MNFPLFFRFHALLAVACICLGTSACSWLTFEPTRIPLTDGVKKFGAPTSHWMVLDVKTSYAVQPYRIVVCRFKNENRWEIKMGQKLYLIEVKNHRVNSISLSTNDLPKGESVTFTNLVGNSYARYVDADKVRELAKGVRMLVCDDGQVGFLYLLDSKAPTAEQYASVRMGEMLLVDEAVEFEDLKKVLSP